MWCGCGYVCASCPFWNCVEVDEVYELECASVWGFKQLGTNKSHSLVRAWFISLHRPHKHVGHANSMVCIYLSAILRQHLHYHVYNLSFLSANWLHKNRHLSLAQRSCGRLLPQVRVLLIYQFCREPIYERGASFHWHQVSVSGGVRPWPETHGYQLWSLIHL